MTATIVNNIISAAYLEARCDSNNVPADSAIRYCDDIYQELIDEKKIINEDFIKKIGKIDTVIYKNQYDLPTDFEKMSQVSIKYTAPTYDERATATVYIKGTKITESGLSYICKVDHTSDTRGDESANRQQIYEGYKPCRPKMIDFEFPQNFNDIGSESDPVYFYENDDLYIYPRPKEVVEEGIIFNYIPKLNTLTTATDDSIIYIEEKLHDAWIAGTAMKFAKHIGKEDLKASLFFDYTQGIEKCRKRWQGRHHNPIQQELPTSLLKYMR